MYKTVQENFLALDPEIRNNFRGLAHDHASNLSETHNALVKYGNELQKINQNLGVSNRIDGKYSKDKDCLLGGVPLILRVKR